MKKDQNLPNKNIHSNNSSGKQIPGNWNYSRNQSPYNSSYRGRSPEQRNSRNSHKIDIVDQIVKIFKIGITIHDRIQTEHNLFLHPVPTIPTINPETHHRVEIEIIPTIGIEVTQIIKKKIRSRNNSYNRSIYQRSSDNYQNRSRNNS